MLDKGLFSGGFVDSSILPNYLLKSLAIIVRIRDVALVETVADYILRLLICRVLSTREQGLRKTFEKCAEMRNPLVFPALLASWFILAVVGHEFKMLLSKLLGYATFSLSEKPPSSLNQVATIYLLTSWIKHPKCYEIECNSKN